MTFSTRYDFINRVEFSPIDFQDQNPISKILLQHSDIHSVNKYRQTLLVLQYRTQKIPDVLLYLRYNSSILTFSVILVLLIWVVTVLSQLSCIGVQN